MSNNNELVFKGFRHLLKAFAPYICALLKIEYGADWWRVAVMGKLWNEQKRDLPEDGPEQMLVSSLDIQRCLILFDLHWSEVFRKRLSIDHRTWAKELVGVRNKLAHIGAQDFNDSDTWRALDTMSRLCEQIAPEHTEEIRSLLSDTRTNESQYQVVMKQATMDKKKEFEDYQSAGVDSGLTKAQAAERANVKGVWFEEDYLRSYPFNETACDTIGFTLDRDVADVGLEGYYNSTLTGVDGRQYGYINNDSDVEQTIIAATNGKSIQTSIDIGAQQIVEKYVNGFKEAMGAQNIGVIVENPSTGEIIAMDGGDRYDLNNPRDLSNVYSEEEIKEMNDVETVKALNGMWSNFTVTDAYEPGSVVKPIVMAAALEKGAIQESDTFVCDGAQVFGDTTIKCAVWPDAHGTQTLGEVIANSCNDAMMQIGAKMGAIQFIKSQSLFNFGTRTGIDLPNEGAGIIHTKDTMGETELACSAFGQGFTCTMIQEINAMCSVINGGSYYQPHLVSEIKDSSGSTVKKFDPILMKQTVSSEISADIRSYMQASVQEGTSRTSKVEGYSSGGKTGTAEKLPRGNGKYLVSFIGFAPVDDPALVIYVVVERIQKLPDSRAFRVRGGKYSGVDRIL